ncbi:helix-turn-helix domain-containing protein [Streptomyces sp. NPDC056061]|uniref:helix-turn-helix domain-containing protein n=1 Tax=Streptomyces sp. NPDC056061 TaxID=3345700 RepID=UPI0035E20A5B
MDRGRIGRRVAHWRERRGFTQADFGRLMGRTRRWVQDLEGGQRQQDPRISVLVRAVDVLRIPLEQLLADGPPERLHKYGAATAAQAAVVADRALAAAERSGDPVAIGAASRRVAKSLAQQQQPETAAEFAVAAARRLHDDLAGAGPLGLSTLGMLYLSAAVATSALNRTPDRVRTAVRYVDQAAEIADRQGADLNADWTSFGPTNTALHRIDVLARFEDGWSALSLRQLEITGQRAGVTGSRNAHTGRGRLSAE